MVAADVVAEASSGALTEVLDLLTERIVWYRFDDLVIVYSNQAWAEANGATPSEVVGHRLDTWLTPSEREGMVRQLGRLGPDTPILQDHMTQTRSDRWIEWTDRYLPGPDGARVLAVGRDVTERREAQLRLAASEERYRELALRDPLTGLANRRLLDELLMAALARTRRSGGCLVVSYLDVDAFKGINDVYGHSVGDAVLEEVGHLLRSTVRGADVIARVGGDEFVVVQECPLSQSLHPTERLSHLSSVTAVHDGVTIRCGISIGSVVATPEHDAASLVAEADAAMYAVKRRKPCAPREE